MLADGGARLGLAGSAYAGRPLSTLPVNTQCHEPSIYRKPMAQNHPTGGLVSESIPDPANEPVDGYKPVKGV